LDDILKDCKLELKDRTLICPITHFPIYGEDLLFKTGLLDTLQKQDKIGTFQSLFIFFFSSQFKIKKIINKETIIGNTVSRV